MYSEMLKMSYFGRNTRTVAFDQSLV